MAGPLLGAHNAVIRTFANRFQRQIPLPGYEDRGIFTTSLRITKIWSGYLLGYTWHEIRTVRYHLRVYSGKRRAPYGTGTRYRPAVPACSVPGTDTGKRRAPYKASTGPCHVKLAQSLKISHLQPACSLHALQSDFTSV